MVEPQVVAAIAGTSGVFGFLALIAYFYVVGPAKEVTAAEESLRIIVEGYPLFTERQVLEILRTFRDDAMRLKALRAFLAHKNQDTAQASKLYDKIKNGVDLQKIVDTRALARRDLARWSSIVLLLIALAGLVYYLLPRPVPPPPIPKALSLSHERLFDEHLKQGEAVSRLEVRPGNYFTIKKPEDFTLVLGFVIDGLVVTNDGDVDASIEVVGLKADSQTAAWSANIDLKRVDDWKTFSIAKALGSESVLKAFSLTEGQGVPIAAMIECADAKDLTNWSGKIQIRVRDELAHLGAELSRPMTLTLDKPAKLTGSGSCPR
ncbi:MULTISPECIES: hypothetical protein [unclassified Mesorhizobium]|uniref:hypothetical protein n=1 Tax=unclassified Mesorhizobium TaxID=325217 RepID=UPI0010931390|nr:MULTISPECIES: hypothetical protein [unclassified Mesorhizobium]TGQ43680.1 hypothetical protein EN857_06205 [Mesorhizobium sp. M4B.F.Ca.ET.214.01.1.1]TGQ62495.1 hypothetical protein EN854_06210 [Mesorhizobium sp. M4B.F.Ca.ET.211.01.1.1]TGU39697.1 hypothetical protein EN793_06205 [Mesorhizobium sp. M4B.F.Ca.ET.150.01.1.1]TIX16171.1 MAG: hypothetical protein E5V46_03495 [Mesorhizobium sp.]